MARIAALRLERMLRIQYRGNDDDLLDRCIDGICDHLRFLANDKSLDGSLDEILIEILVYMPEDRIDSFIDNLIEFLATQRILYLPMKN